MLALAAQLGLWAGKYFAADAAARIAVSVLLVLFGGLAPLTASVLILTGRVQSRVRLRSRTHRAAFVLHAVLAFGFALSLGLRVADAPNRAPKCGGFAVAVAVAELLLTSLIPVAAQKTLVADTKYWRGLGRHNENSELGRATTLTKERQLSQRWTLSLGTWTSFRRSRDLALRLPRRRAEMGLTVASTKLQAIVEESSKRKSLINSDKLKVVEGAVLGSGASATVFRGSYRDADVAVKAFKPVELADEDVEKIGREIEIVAGLRHRNIVYLHGLCVRPPTVCAVSEFCGRGNLAAEIRDRVARRTWDVKARWRAAVDVLSGVAYAHARGVWHRDVKLENFLVADDATVKLSDFGESVRRPVSGGLDDDDSGDLDADEDDVRAVLASLRLETAKTSKRQAYAADEVERTVVGTADYLAPELIAAAPYDERVDVYAAGVVLRCVFAGDDRPWPATHGNFEVFEAVQRGERPSLEGAEPAAAKLIKSSWRGDATTRPAAAALRDRAVRGLREVAGAEGIARLRDALDAPRVSLRSPRTSRADSVDWDVSLRRPSRTSRADSVDSDVTLEASRRV